MNFEINVKNVYANAYRNLLDIHQKTEGLDIIFNTLIRDENLKNFKKTFPENLPVGNSLQVNSKIAKMVLEKMKYEHIIQNVKSRKDIDFSKVESFDHNPTRLPERWVGLDPIQHAKPEEPPTLEMLRMLTIEMHQLYAQKKIYIDILLYNLRQSIFENKKQEKLYRNVIIFIKSINYFL